MLMPGMRCAARTAADAPAAAVAAADTVSRCRCCLSFPRCPRRRRRRRCHRRCCRAMLERLTSWKDEAAAAVAVVAGAAAAVAARPNADVSEGRLATRF